MFQEQQDNAPLTAGFLTQVFASCESRIEAQFLSLETRLETKIEGGITALRDEMIERLEGMEARLLKEFRKWAVRIEAVGRVDETRSIGLDQRIAVIEKRLNDLEDRPWS